MSIAVTDLGEVADVIAGQSPPSSTYNDRGDGLPFYQGKADFGEWHPVTRMWCNAPVKIAMPEDVLISVRAPVGPTNLANERCCIGRGLSALRPRANSLNSRYLIHFLRFHESHLSGKGRGSTFSSITQIDLREIQLPLPQKNGKPDLAEQQRIAAILDKADDIRRKRQEALRLTDDFLRSAFLDLFGDPVTNPKGWEVTTVGDELEFLTSGSRGWAQYYADEGDLFIRIQNLRGGLLDLSDAAYVNAPESAEATRTRVREGDVLLSITADLGRTAVVPPGIGKAHINQHIAILRLSSMTPVFVAQLLASPGGQRQFESLNKSAVKAGLNFDDIRSIKLLNPPLELQTRFAEIVDRIIKNRRRQESAGVEASNAFTSLQQRAFRGEL